MRKESLAYTMEASHDRSRQQRLCHLTAWEERCSKPRLLGNAVLWDDWGEVLALLSHNFIIGHVCPGSEPMLLAYTLNFDSLKMWQLAYEQGGGTALVEVVDSP